MILHYNSSINWCEPDYVYFSFIAEFWNSISGLSLIYSSYYFKKNNQIINDNSFITKTLFLLYVVGIGTILFHSTLLYFFQLFDEIPMLLMAFNYIDLSKSILNVDLNEIESVIRLVTLYAIIFSYFILPEYQVLLFMLSFTVCVVYILFLLIKINKKLDQVTYYDYRIYRIKKYNKIISYIFISSFIIWILDSSFCYYVQHLHFHSMWHILTSIGLYYLNSIFNEMLHLKTYFKSVKYSF